MTDEQKKLVKLDPDAGRSCLNCAHFNEGWNLCRHPLWLALCDRCPRRKWHEKTEEICCNLGLDMEADVVPSVCPMDEELWKKATAHTRRRRAKKVIDGL